MIDESLSVLVSLNINSMYEGWDDAAVACAIRDIIKTSYIVKDACVFKPTSFNHTNKRDIMIYCSNSISKKILADYNGKAFSYKDTIYIIHCDVIRPRQKQIYVQIGFSNITSEEV